MQTKYFANANERRADGSKQLILKFLTVYWTDRNNVRINRLGDFTQDFFDKFSLIEMLTKLMVIKKNRTGSHALRPYQIYAVEEFMKRILGSNLNGCIPYHRFGQDSHKL